jgi:peptide/nickel transport system substrate-binding protein
MGAQEFGNRAVENKENIMRLVLALLVSLIAVTPVLAQEQPRTGGVLKVAMIGEPPSLDLHTTTAVITQQIMWHVFETLYTFDRQYNPIPFLVDRHTVTDNGRTYTFELRRGVKFHTGREMTADELMIRETDPKKRRAAWERVQQLFYEDAGRISDYSSLEAVRKEVRGFQPSTTLILWNVWLER